MREVHNDAVEKVERAELTLRAATLSTLLPPVSLSLSVSLSPHKDAHAFLFLSNLQQRHVLTPSDK